MRAMVLERPREPLRAVERPCPEPGPGELRLRVAACGVCRTDLHIMDGELADPILPLVPGHQIVGRVDALGEGVALRLGQRVGVPWLGWTCGRCRFCTTGRENLCPDARFTGYHLPGGFADHAVVDARFCFIIPDGPAADEVAPLLCAGLIGYRALRMAGDARRVGFYGFGSAAHILAQIAARQGRDVYAFTRPGDAEGQRFARELGAHWAGGSDVIPPVPLDAALIFAPAGGLVVRALAAVDRGGIVVCAGIHMSDIPSFPYHSLWNERVVRSVANLTRRDGEEFLALAAALPVRTRITVFPLSDAQAALDGLRHGAISGSAVLRVAEI